MATNTAHGVVGIDTPNFASLIQDLKRGTFHNSTSSMEIPAAHFDTPSATPRSVVSTGPSITATAATTATVRSSVSSITTDPSVTRVTRVENPGRAAGR